MGSIKNLFIILCLFLSLSIKSETYVGGDITVNTTWTLAGSPYIVISDIFIRSGARLTIEPGVVVKFNTNAGMYIATGAYAGYLTAVGTETDTIIFTSYSGNSNDWKGLIFSGYCDWEACSLKYCKVEKAGQNNGTTRANITVIENTGSNALTIENCLIMNSGVYGIYNQISTPRIYSSAIINNTSYGVYNNSNAPIIIGDSPSLSCDLYGNGTYEIYNNSSSIVNARYNFWGTVDTSIIDTKIYDNFDNASKGIVYYMPINDLKVLILEPFENSYISNTSVNFLWTKASVSDPASYVLQLDTTNLFNEPVYVDTIADTTITMALNELRYYWRVKAFRPGEEGPYTMSYFTIDTTPPTIGTCQ